MHEKYIFFLCLTEEKPATCCDHANKDYPLSKPKPCLWCYTQINPFMEKVCMGGLAEIFTYPTNNPIIYWMDWHGILVAERKWRVQNVCVVSNRGNKWLLVTEWNTDDKRLLSWLAVFDKPLSVTLTHGHRGLSYLIQHPSGNGNWCSCLQYGLYIKAIL